MMFNILRILKPGVITHIHDEIESSTSRIKIIRNQRFVANIDFAFADIGVKQVCLFAWQDINMPAPGQHRQYVAVILTQKGLFKKIKQDAFFIPVVSGNRTLLFSFILYKNLLSARDRIK
ncbi:hypothetical protein JW992_01240 [candidate division KSB1 bacterium]|nr:hypothetical protein [candidate division KSB1 bacterium]